MKVFFALMLIGCFCFFSGSAFGTAQMPDKIVYEGTKYSLHSNPMEEYFAKFPDKKPKTGIMSTALWRGYVATFEFEDKMLYLKDIEVYDSGVERNFGTDFKSVLEEVVPAGERLKIDWLNGLLVLPFGEIVNYVHMGYGSTFENYILIEVAKGEFVKSKEMDYKQYASFKERQFEAFKKTQEYADLVEEMKKDGDYDAEFTESFLKNFVTSYSSKILVD